MKAWGIRRTFVGWIRLRDNPMARDADPDFVTDKTGYTALAENALLFAREDDAKDFRAAIGLDRSHAVVEADI